MGTIRIYRLKKGNDFEYSKAGREVKRKYYVSLDKRVSYFLKDHKGVVKVVKKLQNKYINFQKKNTPGLKIRNHKVIKMKTEYNQ